MQYANKKTGLLNIVFLRNGKNFSFLVIIIKFITARSLICFIEKICRIVSKQMYLFIYLFILKYSYAFNSW